MPALYSFVAADGHECKLLTIVDDLLFSESRGYSISDMTIAALRERFGEVTSEREPTTFAGLKLERDWDACTIKVSMPATIEAMVREFWPHLMHGAPDSLLKGKRLEQAANALVLPAQRPTKLSRVQRSIQRKTGALKWVEKIMPSLCLGVHRLSCVMSCPPDEAVPVAEALAWRAWQARHDGITYGGDTAADLSKVEICIKGPGSLDDGAPTGLLAAADATWTGLPAGYGPPDVMGLIVTWNRAAIYCCTKKIGIAGIASSHEVEGIASGKMAEVNSYVREIARGLGVALDGPTRILTDNAANERVAMGKANAGNSRHFLRRYFGLMRRVAAGEAALVKVPDAENPADFLTKFVDLSKLRKSLDYATNARAAGWRKA